MPYPRFITNLACTCLACTLLGIWIDYHTHALEGIATLLSGGGVLAIASVFYAISPEHRKEQIKDWFGRFVGSRAYRRYLWFVCVGLLLIANFVGSVHVQLTAGEPPLDVFILDSERDRPQPRALETAKDVRHLVWTSWFSPAEVIVKVKGYPKLKTRVRPFPYDSIFVPTDVRSVVLLVRPTPMLMQVARSGQLKLKMDQEDDPQHSALVDFNGQALLINGEDDIPIPPEIAARWPSEGIHTNTINTWMRPQLVPNFPLPPGKTLNIKILMNCNNSICEAYGSPRSILITPRLLGPFVQEVVLHAPSETAP